MQHSLEQKIQQGFEFYNSADEVIVDERARGIDLLTKACAIFEEVLLAQDHIDPQLLSQIRRQHLWACRRLADYYSERGIKPCERSYSLFDNALKIDPENIALLKEKGEFALSLTMNSYINFVDSKHFKIAIESFTSLLSHLEKDSKAYLDAKIKRAHAYYLLFAQQNEKNQTIIDDSFYKALMELNEVSIRSKNKQVTIDDNEIHLTIKGIFSYFSEKTLKTLETTLSLEDELFLLTQLQDNRTVLGWLFGNVQSAKIREAASQNQKYESLNSKVNARINTIWKKLELFKNTEKERNKNSFFYYMPPDIINLLKETFIKEVIIDAKPGPGKNH